MSLIQRLRRQPESEGPPVEVLVDGRPVDLRMALAMSRRIRDFDHHTPVERGLAKTLAAVLERVLDEPSGRHRDTAS
jgi:hypothetical protein